MAYDVKLVRLENGGFLGDAHEFNGLPLSK